MQGNVIRIYPEIRLEKTEIKAKPLNWVQHLVQNYKRKQGRFCESAKGIQNFLLYD